jgi:hypothetical protein
MRIFIYSIFILIVLIWNTNTFGFEVCKSNGGVDIRWRNPDTMYRINDSGGPSGTITAIKEGMQTWTDVATSDFIFYYDGPTTSTDHSINDRTNIVTFGSLSVGTLAENASWYRIRPPSREGELLDSDIRFNSYYSWSTTGVSGTYDVQNVGTHEHGHSLCLADLYSGADSEKTMYGYVSDGETKKQTLNLDDIDGITYLYTCPNFQIRNERTTSEYAFLQDAYDYAVSDDILLIQATVFTEDLFIDLNKLVLLEGGYDCSYSNNTGVTTINGNVTISNGTLIIQNSTLEVQSLF